MRYATEEEEEIYLFSLPKEVLVLDFRAPLATIQTLKSHKFKDKDANTIGSLIVRSATRIKEEIPHSRFQEVPIFEFSNASFEEREDQRLTTSFLYVLLLHAISPYLRLLFSPFLYGGLQSDRMLSLIVARKGFAAA